MHADLHATAQQQYNTTPVTTRHNVAHLPKMRPAAKTTVAHRRVFHLVALILDYFTTCTDM